MTQHPPKNFDTKQPLWGNPKWTPKGRDISKRGRGIKPIADHIATVTKPLLGKRGFASHRIIFHWGDIVGDMLAQQCTPDRIRYAQGDRTNGTLHIHAYGVQALELEYLKPQVIQQVNAFCGYNAVGDIKITQTPPPISPKESPKPKFTPTPQQTAETTATLNAQLADMPDSPLKTALMGLGKSIHNKPNTN